jgi:D-glycero-D-manno-heptose 1,7-bisphosphate phosphatase
MSRPTVFLDRDGTMIEDVGYLRRLADVRWFPWTIGAVRALNRAGFLVCVTTNQGGIGLGLIDDAFVGAAHEHMARDMAAGDAHVDGWFVCPHHPRSTVEAFRKDCDCRKPRAGMINQARQRFDIDVSRSFVVGDSARDIGMAAAAGVRGVLVRTGDGENELARQESLAREAAHVADHLAGAVAWILREAAQSKGNS